MLPLLLLLACRSDPEGKPSDAPSGQADEPARQDILHTALRLDLAALEGEATLTVVPRTGAQEVVFDVGDLVIAEVQLNGEAVDFEVREGHLHLPTTQAEQEVSVLYNFRPHEDWGGWMPSRGLTFVWPTFCGNLFPCDPEPADGTTFSLEVTGTDSDQVAVYPTDIPEDAPSYMVAVAVGEYTETVLGTTTAGTELSLWSLPGEEEDGLSGTQNLVAAFDYFEQTYGPYAYGKKAGSVSADWDDIGGMEHHPYWHIASFSLRSEEVHAHEAAHGWFGDAVRVECWEDFVLSEGTTTYISAHALQAVDGPNVFHTYVESLNDICATGSRKNTIALPDTCGEIELLTDPLWSMVPYMKGACFYEDVADLIGPALLDQILAEFYQANMGEAATMREMIELIQARAEPDQGPLIDQLVIDWLTNLECPADYADRCGLQESGG